MARLKYYDKATSEWKYADIAGGGGSSGYYEKELLPKPIDVNFSNLNRDGYQTYNIDYTLNGNVTDYDIIVFFIEMNKNGKFYHSRQCEILVSNIILNDSNQTAWNGSHCQFDFGIPTTNMTLSGWFKKPNVWRFINVFCKTDSTYFQDFRIASIKGVKISANSTDKKTSEWNNITGTLTFTKFEYMTLSATTSTDLTDVLNLGSKLKFTNEGKIKYGIVTGLTASTIDVFLGTDYTAVAGITDVQYSNMKTPAGFPTDPSKWTFTYLGTKTDSLNNPPVQTIINLGGNSFTAPKGVWNICYNSGYQLGHANTSATANYVFAGLGTKPTGKLGDKEAIIPVFKDRIALQGTFIGKSFSINVPSYTISEPTKFYHNICNEGADSSAGAGKILYSGTFEFKAVCAYL